MNPKPIKVVVVGTFSRNKAAYHPREDTDEYYVASWGALWARRLKSRYPELDIEVWRPESKFASITQRQAFNILCTIFPYRFPVISDIITWDMLKILFRYQRKYTLVIHLNTIFDYKFNILAPLLLRKTRFVLSHHGGKIPGDDILKSTVKRKVLLWSYKNIDSVTYLRRAIKNWIESLNNPPRLEFLPVGADFTIFKPLNKPECRRKLGLPLDKIFAVYVGPFYRLKGVDHILFVYEQCKTENFEVLLVGGKSTDELYGQVVKSGNRFWGHIDQHDLVVIYSAADFYIHPAFNPKFGGFDTVLLEALACNIPVVSSQFNELIFDYSDLGILIENETEILSKVRFMIQNHSSFKRCREVALQYFDGNTAILDKLNNIYTNHV